MILNSFKYFIFCLFILIAPLNGFSQIDTTYVKKYKENFALKITTSNKFVSLLHDNNINEVTYDPNRPITIGLGFN